MRNTRTAKPGTRRGNGPIIAARPWDHLPDATTEAVKRERERLAHSRATMPYARFKANQK